MWKLRLLGFALALGAAVPAAADSSGAIGPLVALRVNQDGSDLHAAFRGEIHVENQGQLDEYRWGGTNCSSFTLTEAEVAMLQRALDNPRIVVRPFWKAGTSTNCLVAFRLIRRDWQGLF